MDDILDDLQDVRKGLTWGSSQVVKFPQKTLADEFWMSTVDPNEAGISRLSRLRIAENSEDNDTDLVSKTSKLSIRHSSWNRIHTRLVFYMIGRPIYRFKSIRELLEAFYDAIDGKIHILIT